jgi:hypothetical protein
MRTVFHWSGLLAPHTLNMRIAVLAVVLCVCVACSSGFFRVSGGRSLDHLDYHWLASVSAEAIEAHATLMRDRTWYVAPVIVRTDGEVLNLGALRTAVTTTIIALGGQVQSDARDGSYVLAYELHKLPAASTGALLSATYVLSGELRSPDGRVLAVLGAQVEKRYETPNRWK